MCHLRDCTWLMTDEPIGGFFNRMVAVVAVTRDDPLGIKLSSISTVEWVDARGYSKHKQHQTSHFTSDCSTRTTPERSQKVMASQLSNIIDDKRTELKRNETAHVKIAGVSCEKV